MNSRIRVGVLGASGYGGAELLRRLWQHPQLRVQAVGSRQFLGQGLAACWPQLAGLLPELVFQDNEAVIAESDVVFCATPHGATAVLVKKALDQGKQVLDLSADFRLPPEVYQQWYGLEHPHPELYPKARYGLVELHRHELKGAELIAVPGCNSTTAILALAPLAAHQLLGDDTVITIMAGVSGAGRGLDLGLHYAEANENLRPYKVAGTHRHIAEVELSLGRAGSQNKEHHTHSEVFTPRVSLNPHLVPMTRGILASCVTKAAKATSTAALLELFQYYYQDEPMVLVQNDLPQTKAVCGSDRCIMTVRFDERTQQISVFAVSDNLGRGAAGQALQCFNVMQGFPETQALQQGGLWP